jgi:hypothetical protein
MQGLENGVPLMKNASACGNENTLDKRADTMRALIPHRRDTIVAGVLTRLFEGGSPLTAWDGVEEFRTLHLNAAIRTLKNEYGWPIESRRFPTYKRDGTIFYVTGYNLPQAAIDYAYNTLDAGFWIQTVKLAQAVKRMRDDEKAAALDFYRLTTNHPSFRKIGQYLYRR